MVPNGCWWCDVFFLNLIFFVFVDIKEKYRQTRFNSCVYLTSLQTVCSFAKLYIYISWCTLRIIEMSCEEKYRDVIVIFIISPSPSNNAPKHTQFILLKDSKPVARRKGALALLCCYIIIISVAQDGHIMTISSFIVNYFLRRYIIRQKWHAYTSSIMERF